MMTSRYIFIQDISTEKLTPLQKGQDFLYSYFVIICLFCRPARLIYEDRSLRLLNNCFCFIIALGLNSNVFASSECTEAENPKYEDVRDCILKKMGSAQKRIWLSTAYLTDGEILASLHIAKYRKLDVRVLLDRSKANNYMSRLRNLNDQDIPVFSQSSLLQRFNKTQILSDDELVVSTKDLNFMNTIGTIELRLGNDEQKNIFISQVENISSHSDQKLLASPQWINAGRARSKRVPDRNGWRTPGTEAPPKLQVPVDGTFNYDQSPQSRGVPSGTPTRLPKELLSEKNKMLKLKNAK